MMSTDEPRHITKLREQVARRPNDDGTLQRLVEALLEAGRNSDALPFAEQLASLKPRRPAAWLAASRAALATRNLVRARDWLEVARRLGADNEEFWLLMADMAYDAGNDNTALECLQQVLTKNFRSAQAWNLQGRIMRRRNNLAMAATCYERALEADPDSDAVGGLYMLRRSQAEWRDEEDLLRRTISALRRNVDRGERMAITPSFAQRIPVDPELLLEINRCEADRHVAGAREVRENFGLSRPVSVPHERLRIGYLTNGFRNFPQGHLVRDLFHHHDRTEFEVHGYCYVEDDGSEFRRDIEAGIEFFHDVAKMDVASTARRIMDDGIDILIDMKGFSSKARSLITTIRPAPVQVNWLGFPGSWGSAEAVDYILGDPLVTPPGEEHLYAEAVVRLPGCYAPADPTMRLASPERGERAKYGLPAEGVVFCTFNGIDKLSPGVFADWKRILEAVPGSILWMFAPSRNVQRHLVAAAGRMGVPRERLRFAGLLPKREHLRRIAHADLFLDSFPYGAHTTASDALLAGVPVLTWYGPTFASRVATSVVTAAGLPELSYPDRQSQVQAAIELGRDPERLEVLRKTVRERLPESRLVDSAAFVAGLESAYRAMWARHQSGEAPSTLEVSLPVA